MDNLKETQSFSPIGGIALVVALVGNVIFFIGLTDQWNERHPIATTIICTITMAIAGLLLVRGQWSVNLKWVLWCALVGLVEGLLIAYA